MTTYYNTTHEADTLKYKVKADKQDDQIIEFFRKHWQGSFTPCDIWSKVFTPQTPITSVRRSITNLENAGMLKKTEIKRDGLYGRPNYTWRLVLPELSKQYELW